MRTGSVVLFLLATAACDGQSPSLPQADAHVVDDQHRPQPIIGGFALDAGDLHARLDARGLELPDRGWRFDYLGDPAQPEVDGNRVIYRRGAGVTEWYEALPEGIEQGFTIAELPPGGGDLVVRGRVESSQPGQRIDGGVAFGTLRYDGLVVVDATGRPLDAAIEWDAASSMLALRVDDAELADAQLPITIDPLLSTASWSAESDQAGAGLGVSVAAAGDVNGDGYADVVVGAYLYDGGQTDEGRAYLYLGSASGLGAAPVWTAEGNQAGANFGVSVAAAGDVDGDGFGDVLVGASGHDNDQADEGRAYLYLGSGSGLSATPAWTAEGDQVGANFGVSVAGAGDVDGDGDGDVVVGAYTYDGGQTDEGRAYLYLGSGTGLGASAAWTAEGDQASASFGYSVAAAGDVDGDGFGDVLVGALNHDGGQSDEGRAFLFLGSGSGLSAVADWTAESNQAGANFGYSVAGAGDVNGDGFGDVLVGAIRYDNGHTDEGRAFLYLGSASIPAASPVWTAESDQTTAWFGWSVAGAGDVNGDGFGDVVVGANLYDGGQTDEGRAYLYLGSASGPSAVPAWTAERDVATAQLGVSVAAAGDVNGDGFGDVLAGAHEYDNGQSNEGGAFLYLGFAAGLPATPAWTNDANQVDARFGYSVASAGDVNGDGFGDVIVGAYEYDNGQLDEGRAFVYLGSATGLATTAAWTAESNQAGARFGLSVAAAGDVNGDGYGDVVVGADWYDGGQTDEGRAFLYLGSASGPGAAAAWTAESDQASAQFGYSVAAAGDVNGDGYGDVVVGAVSYDNGQTDEGRAFLYLGSESGLATTAAWTADPDQVDARFGIQVAAAGDVNGDGFGDAVVGAYQYDSGQTEEGRAFLYLGSETGLETTAAWTAESDQTGARLGSTVASAGDVNRDGYGDVVVGANAYDSGQTEEGRAFLYLGSAIGLGTTAAWTAESDQTGGYFGTSVASAGDVNGDGHGDVMVGAHVFDGGSTDEGRAFVYLGTPSGLAATAAWTADSDQASAQIGISLGSAGDVNGDGFGDVIAAAPHYDGPDTNEGRAWLYLGGDGAPGLPRGLGQFESPAGTTRIGIGTGTGSAVVLKGRVSQEGSIGGGLRLQVEVKPLGTPFDGVASGISIRRSGGQIASVTVAGLSNGAYHWRARVIYPVGTGHGRWVAFGGNTEAEPDFRVSVPLLANGASCTAGAQCAAGICEDGICCAVTCGLCNSCNAAGTACGTLPADDAACGPIDCDALDQPCRNHADLTANRCDALGACEPANGSACLAFTDLVGPCDDGFACTTDDTCTAGTCVGTESCDAGVPPIDAGPDAGPDAGAAGVDAGADAAVPGPDAGADRASLLGCDCRTGSSRGGPTGQTMLLLVGATLWLARPWRRRRRPS